MLNFIVWMHEIKIYYRLLNDIIDDDDDEE